jgi:type IV pilus assembly protein PilF
VKTAAILASVAFCLTAGCASNSGSKPQPERAAQVNLEMAVDYLRRGNLQQAKEKMDRSLEQNPRDARAQSIAAMLYERLGDSAKADAHFQRALALAPQDPEIKNNYAAWLCQKKRFDRGEKLALEAASNALYKTPEVAFLNAGNCAREAGNLPRAEENYRRAVAVRPRFGEALYQMADLAFEQAEYVSARGFYERYLEVGRTNPATLWLGVRIERSLGNEAQAQHYAQRLKTEYPTAVQTKALLESERNPG